MDRGPLSITFDNCPIRQGISPRLYQHEALTIAKKVARFLRDLEEAGHLLGASSEDE